jgi:hypothetical protein
VEKLKGHIQELKMGLLDTATKDKAKMIFVALFLLFLLGKCTYGIGYPWNCKEAKQALQEANRENDEAHQELSENPSQSTFVHARVTTDKRMRAESKVSSLCY